MLGSLRHILMTVSGKLAHDTVYKGTTGKGSLQHVRGGPNSSVDFINLKSTERLLKRNAAIADVCNLWMHKNTLNLG